MLEDNLYPIISDQGGYFSARQARDAGIPYPLLSHYVKSGRIERVRHGVYRLVYFPETPYADFFIAWLSAGEKAVISHQSALFLYDLTDLMPVEIDLTVPRTASRRLAGVRLHTARLDPEEITRREGLPVTTLPRTLIDLVRSGTPTEWIEQAVRQALERGLISRNGLYQMVEARGGKAARVILPLLER